MKKHINSIIISIILTFAFIISGCSSSINNPEKNKKQNTNTSTGSSSADVSDEPELELDSTELPLTLKVIEAGKIILSGRNSFERISIQKGNALIFDPADIIIVQAGDIIHFYGKNYKGNGSANLRIECTSDCYVYGNAMSLIYYTDFEDEKEIPDNYTFQKLFLNNNHIKNHETLDLVLPATTLSEGCYKMMFYGCTGLTRSPELPAATLPKESYNYMFYNCKNLDSVKCLATDISAADCTTNWLVNVSDTGTFLSAQENSIWQSKDKSSGIPRAWTANPPFEVVDAKELPLTLEAIEDGSIIFSTYQVTFTNNNATSFSVISSNKYTDLKYSKNGEEAKAVTGNIQVSAGDKVCFYAKGPGSDTRNFFSNINCTGDCYVYGNIMSLIDPVEYKNLTTIPKSYCFYNLFSSSNGPISITGLINGSSDTHLKNCAIELVLPATTLTNYCYFGMFNHCSGLTVASELPAETLKPYCYKAMYQNCDGLTIAPELPATTLSTSCYESMFENCDGLTIPSELQAGSLVESCYYRMFYGCKGLISAPELPATTLATKCYYEMFAECTNLSNTPKELPAEILKTYCYYSMFKACKALTSAPEIKATTLAEGCCIDMFMSCKELVSAPELPVKVLAKRCYERMFGSCTKLKVAPVLQAETLATDCYKEMFYECPNIQIIKCLAPTGTNNSQGLFTNIKSAKGLLFCIDTDIFDDCPSGWKKVKESPLTLELIQDGSIDIKMIDSFKDMYWLINGTTLEDISSKGTLSSWFEAGDTISFFASGHNSGNSNNLTINCSSDCYIYGDLMSLDNYSDTISQAGEFKGLFKDNTHIKNHPSKKLILSAQTLSDNCYEEMFYGCTGLTSAPELLAATLKQSCYSYMFYGCTGLTSAPALPAKTLKFDCYGSMFSGCAGLTSAPELPATTLDLYCYSRMFYGCAKLTSAPELPADTLQKYCYEYMFAGCTSLETAPDLKARTLESQCYSHMFDGCTSLKYIKCLAMNNVTSSNGNYPNTEFWVKKVPSGGIFVCDRNGRWMVNGTNAIPDGWVVRYQ